jgi:hypothetical protein
VAILAIAAGCAALIVNGGVIYNIFRELREDAIHGRHGHLQVYRRGYTENHRREPSRYLLPAGEAERIVALTRSIPHIARVTRRREFTGMISREDRYVAFVGIGVEPSEDMEFSRHMTMREGKALSPEDPHGVVAGLGLAEKIAAGPGARLTLTANGETGALNAVARPAPAPAASNTLQSGQPRRNSLPTRCPMVAAIWMVGPSRPSASPEPIASTPAMNFTGMMRNGACGSSSFSTASTCGMPLPDA